MSSPLATFSTNNMLDDKIKERPLSPLSNIAPKPTQSLGATSPITDSDIESLSKDIQKIGATTERIINTVSLQKFNELGDIMARIKVTHGSLDPKKIHEDLQPRGVAKAIRWIKGTVIDIKTELSKRLDTASAAFDSISKDIESHMARHNTWIRDLELLYEENIQNYQFLQSLIKRAEEMKRYQSEFIKSLPKIDPNDPDAMLKSQSYRDMESRLNSIEIKLDNFIRRRVVVENNGPLIRSQQNASKQTVNSFREILETIPDMKMQFVLYKQSLETQDSVEFNNMVRNLVNQTIQQGASNAHDTAISSAQALNSSVITNNTLEHIRERMLSSLTQVQSIEQQARAQREADEVVINESQKKYLETLTTKGAL